MAWQWVHVVLFILAVSAGVYLFISAVRRRYEYVKLGRPGGFPDSRGEGRMKEFVSQVFGQRKLMKDWKSGLMHIVMFYGFIILQLGALDIIIKGFREGRNLPVPGYDAFSLLQEMTVAAILIAAGYAAYRRYGEKISRLKRGWKPSLVLFFILGLMTTVLLTLSFERVLLQHEFSAYAPISSAVAAALEGMPAAAAQGAYYACWWAHLLILLAFLIYIPQSKHFHLITGPLNLWFRRNEPVGRLKKLDLEDEEAESFGVGKVEDFTQKQMLDFYACVECGRCTNMCPASNTGKPLSPMHLIMKLRDHLTEKGAAVTSKSPWVPGFAFTAAGAHAMSGEGAPEWNPDAVTDIRPTMAWQKESWAVSDRKPEDMELIGDVMTAEEIWACTTCRNCEDQCPVGNEHVDKIIDMRRWLVLMQGDMPSEGQRAMQNIERQGNPWGLNRNDRAQWTGEIEGFSVPTVKDDPDFEILYFVGSMGAYDLRSRKISKAFARLMNEAGVRFAILGNEEKNSGDTPRRMGNEMLFQQLCTENIETFKRYNVKRIVTACPHTYNTLKNEYPDFGLEGVEVLHHTELLEQLVREGRLVPQFEVKERVTYHDSCYLGRYNNVYEQPRNVLKAIPGIELVEMERSRENGMCCGAGGGMMWMEETAGKRVNVARTEQALSVGPTMVSSACPYCLTMMEDGIKTKEAESLVKARDIAEILEYSIFGLQ